MQNPLSKLGDLNKLRKQAQQMQQQLSAETVEVEQDGVRIVMSGDQKIREFSIDGAEDTRIRRAVEKAIEESQKIAAQKLAGMSGGFGKMLN
jgi:DNA-binding protein YbaB